MMKRVNVFFFIIFALYFVNEGIGQSWQKVYFPNTGPWGVIESYDNGFVIAGMYYSNFTVHWGLILKTDINGVVLWHKRVGTYNDGTVVYDIKQTNDGGYILTGATCQVNEKTDPYILKLDACGNIDWCRIYSTPGDDDIGKAISPVSDGYISYIFRHGDDSIQPQIWLFKLDDSGDVIWKQSYAQTDTLLRHELCYTLHVTNDDYFLLSGYCYYPDSITGQTSYLKPLLIKVDQFGNYEWELPWFKINGEIYYGQGIQSITSLKNTIYTGARHIIPFGPYQGDKPSLLKTSDDGNEISYHDLNQNSVLGITSTIDWFADSTLALGGGWWIAGGEPENKITKVDTNGNILKIKDIIVSYETFQDGVVTNDNKLLIVAGIYTNMLKTYAWKLNSDLEYDSIYTQPFVYDSLCPYPIASDTIPLDCVVVGIDEPFQNPKIGRLKIYPNPASDKIHIVIPEHLKTETTIPSFNVTTMHYQWQSAILEVYDLFGRRMYSLEVRQEDKELSFDVSSWKAGMYVVRLVYQNHTVGSVKVIIQ
ncbi:MAG: T9SS type A sorting domain-containing protein [Bacteroidetes bacterium]|nr:T9SS type A sorting domain-containing protein [Bacteroidota bacterium]